QAAGLKRDLCRFTLAQRFPVNNAKRRFAADRDAVEFQSRVEFQNGAYHGAPPTACLEPLGKSLRPCDTARVQSEGHTVQLDLLLDRGSGEVRCNLEPRVGFDRIGGYADAPLKGLG